MGKTRMTVGQALVRFLDNQYVSVDGKEIKFVEGIFTIFGHGIVVGLGQALEEDRGGLKYYPGKSEQGMAHVCTGFARQSNRHRIMAASSSIGPGAANMVTACACATVNNIPLLVLPGDTFATRQPDPVLQQVEQPTSLSTTTNDAFRAVCKYWDRINRPEQLMTAMINAMRVLTDPAETGAVCIALPQDVQGESFDYPDYFFQKRVHKILRQIPVKEEFDEMVELILASKKPLIICGGGAKYSEAGAALEALCEKFNIPFAETQAGKSTCKSSHPYNLGGLGATGNLAANTIAHQADLIISIGSRMSDFTTSSKSLYSNPDVKFIMINLSRFHAYKLDAVKVQGDAKLTIEMLDKALTEKGYKAPYTTEIQEAKASWAAEMAHFATYNYKKEGKTLIAAQREGSVDLFAEQTGSDLSQVAAICEIRKTIDDNAIIVGAAGSLPGDLQRMWTTDEKDAYHMEYGYSCMGYEIAAALGAKFASPEKEVYSMCGDGSFYMLHSEILTAIQENMKINVLLFDNASFGCINNLQMNNGIGSLGTELRMNSGNDQHDGDFIVTDFAKIGEGYGMKTYTVKTLEELHDALVDSKKQTVSTLIDIKVLPKTMTDDYASWWHVGVASTSKSESVQKAYANKEATLAKARMY